MLLAVVLTPSAHASALPAFMEICTPQGIVYLPFDQPLHPDAPQDRKTQDLGGSVDGCPVCTAFGQLNGTTPPAAVTLSVLCERSDPTLTRRAAPPQGHLAQLPQSRAPPRLR